MKRPCGLVFAIWACLAVFFAATGRCEDQPAFDEPALEFFEKEVRPILVTRCFECHSGGERAPKGGLRLDSRQGLLKGGDTGPAMTMDDPGKSLFVSVINYGDIYQMPPKSKLPASEIAVLTKWATMGLPWPKESSSAVGTVKPFNLTARAAEHWCWKPVHDVPLPAVKTREWPVSTVDRFILAKLEAKGLKPAPPADKHALLRRVYFDLIGLPPTPEEVQEFLVDQSPQAFEHVVERLLGSVHFGERWGRHWLDLTRYAETRGHEFEPIIPNAWQYRDYVIRALNADVPYDRFLTEHIAGDLVEPRWRLPVDRNAPAILPINESLLGTGFWFLGEEVHSPVDIRKDETDRMDNRLDVMSKTFLGLTVACARCHDHKFDAISQRDYYALAGFAISGSYRQVRVDTFEQHRQIALQLNELRNKARDAAATAILEKSRPVLDKLDLYWQSALRALNDDALKTAPIVGGKPLAAPVAEIINRIATENNLDIKLLGLWCVELAAAKEDKKHPLHGLFDVPRAGEPKTPEITPSVVSTSQTNARPGLVVDFGDPFVSRPIQDGVSFGLQPVEPGRLIIGGTPESPDLRVATVGAWERDLFWKNIKLAPGAEPDYGTLGSWRANGRMVRSPEFVLTAFNVWYLVRGSVHAYATVNSHLVIGGPLHGSLLREFKHADDKWHWVSHGLENYRGHRMHVEFSPVDDASCAIAMIVQSDETPKVMETNWNWMNESIPVGEQLAQRISTYHRAFRDAANLFAESNGASDVKSPKNVSNTPDVGHAQLADWFVTHAKLFCQNGFEPFPASLKTAEAELEKQVQWESTLAPAMLEGNGIDEYLLVRGNSNTPKEQVSRRFLEAFHPIDKDASTKTDQTNSRERGPVGPNESNPVQGANVDPGLSGAAHGSGRLGLAADMLRSPLASRVAVNRIWHHLFGRGIVPSVDNFGALGVPPSHPELLDHLAIQFVRDGWSTKSMIRSLVLSRTYQMSSRPTDSDAADPNNELWHRMPIKRLEGEAIRDSLLAVSGRLDRTSFGPSVPIHLTAFMQGRGRPGGSGPLDGNGRRSIYIAVRRNFLSPMMLAFDTPSPFSTVGRRTISNVPAQALILMNDPFVIEQAKRWADRVLADTSSTTEQRLDRLYLTAFARPPTSAESSEAVRFLEAQGANRPENQQEAWMNLCHVMFNIKEFVFIE